MINFEESAKTINGKMSIAEDICNNAEGLSNLLLQLINSGELHIGGCEENKINSIACIKKYSLDIQNAYYKKQYSSSGNFAEGMQ